MSWYWPYPYTYPYPTTAPCPTCGKCPTCGAYGWPNAPKITWTLDSSTSNSVTFEEVKKTDG